MQLPDKKIEYNSLKLFGTLYPFSKKKIEKLFDGYLLESVSSYMLHTRAMDDERLHVLFSRKTVTEYASYILLFLSVVFLIFTLKIPCIICFVLSLISFIGSKLFHKQFKDYYTSTVFTSGILNYDTLEELREYLLEKEEKK